MRRRHLLCPLLLPLACGGVSTDPLGTVTTYDERLQAWCVESVRCLPPGNYSLDDCKRLFGGMQISDACVEAAQASTCEEQEDPTSSFSTTCWDRCEGDYRQCIGDLRHECFNGNLWVFECELECQYLLNKTYTGTCGQFSPDGTTHVDRQICWCE